MTEHEMARMVFEQMEAGVIRTADEAEFALDDLRDLIAVAFFCGDTQEQAIAIWKLGLPDIAIRTAVDFA